MTPYDVFISAQRRWRPLLALLLLGALGGAAAHTLLPEQYSASAQMLISAQPSEGAGPGEVNTYVRDRLPTYVELASSAAVLSTAAGQLPPGTAALLGPDNPDFVVEPDSVILTITATAPTGEQAADIANTVADTVTAELPLLDSVGQQGSTVQASVYDRAIPDPSPSSISLPVAIAMGTAVGLGLALVLAVALGSAETRARAGRTDSPPARRVPSAPSDTVRSARPSTAEPAAGRPTHARAQEAT